MAVRAYREQDLHRSGDFAAGHASMVVSPVGDAPDRRRSSATNRCSRLHPPFAADGAEVLFNISNDGWFGKSAARYQHLEIVRMRAAENRRWILRATNDGITAAIDPAGRVRAATAALYTEARRAMGFDYSSELTFYTRSATGSSLLCALLAGCAAAISCAGLPARRRL